MNLEVTRQIFNLPLSLVVLLIWLAVGLGVAALQRCYLPALGAKPGRFVWLYWLVAAGLVLWESSSFLLGDTAEIGALFTTDLTLQGLPGFSSPLRVLRTPWGPLAALLVCAGMLASLCLDGRSREPRRLSFASSWPGIVLLMLVFSPHALLWSAASLSLVSHRKNSGSAAEPNDVFVLPGGALFALSLLAELFLLARLAGQDVAFRVAGIPWAFLTQSNGVLFPTALNDLALFAVVGLLVLGMGLLKAAFVERGRAYPKVLMGAGLLIAHLARVRPVLEQGFSWTMLPIGAGIVVFSLAVWAGAARLARRTCDDMAARNTGRDAPQPEGLPVPKAPVPLEAWMLRHGEAVLVLSVMVLLLGLAGVGRWLNL